MLDDINTLVKTYKNDLKKVVQEADIAITKLVVLGLVLITIVKHK